MLVAEDEAQSVLTATENGYGKRTPIVEYTRHGRGTKGMIAIQQTERNGQVVAAALVRAGGRGHADLDRRRADPHQGRLDPRDGPLDAGRDADQSRRGRDAGRPQRVVEGEDEVEGNGNGEGADEAPSTARAPSSAPAARAGAGQVRRGTQRMGRVFNFGSGPAALPEAVLEQARDELLDWHGTGMSVMEMSHRGNEFIGDRREGRADLRDCWRSPRTTRCCSCRAAALARTRSCR